MLGCCPAQVLFEEVFEITKKDNVEVPRKFADYKIQVNKDKIPNGVELLCLPQDMDKL